MRLRKSQKFTRLDASWNRRIEFMILIMMYIYVNVCMRVIYMNHIFNYVAHSKEKHYKTYQIKMFYSKAKHCKATQQTTKQSHVDQTTRGNAPNNNEKKRKTSQS